MFNAVVYVLCVLYETLNQTKAKNDEMATNWEDMEQQVRVSRATAAMEKKLRERSMEAIETEREQLTQSSAIMKEEMAVVRNENVVWSKRLHPPSFGTPLPMQCLCCLA